MISTFPKICWNKKCEHFHVRDMSIDDLECFCDILKVRIDACDEDWSFVVCPRLDEWKAEGYD